MKRRKCMADGGVLEKANERVRQAVGGIAAFLNVGRPATTEIVSGGRTNVPDGRQIVQADDRADMPQDRNPRRFADEVDQRKQARSGGYEAGGILLNDSADRLNQQAQVAPGGIASFLSGIQDAIRVPTQPIGPSLAQSSAPVGMSPQSQGLLTGIRDYSTTPAQLANSGKPAFVNEDGSPRNMGQSVQTVAQQPIMTMKERDIAAGLDPNRAYRPGSAADPYASGVGAAATAQQSSYPADLARNPIAAAPARRPRRQVGYARGGILPVLGIGSGTSDSIPVVLAGHKVRVSNGEGVAVLPKKTMDTPGAVAAVESLIEQTNGKPPVPMKDGGEYAGGALPVRQYPDEIDVARGLMETENARAADAAARAKAARAGAVVPVAAQETYRPDWTQPRNVPAQFSHPAVEGVVETVADQRAASMAAQPRALNAPTNVVPPISQPNWTSGGNPPNVGPIGGGQWANQGWNSPPGRSTMPQGSGIQSVLQALPAPTPELMKASSDARTAAGAKAAGRASKEAAAYASRPAFETSPWANARPNAAIAGKVLGRVIPAVGGAISAANIADVATDPNKTKADVATQAAREAGGLGAAVAGGALGAKAGAALGVLGGPLAPITVPAGALAGGIVGGLASNYGANALMDLGGDAPAKDANGVVTQFFGGSAQQPTVDPVRARHNAILNSGAAAGSINLPITQAAKQTAFANTDAARRVAANEDSGAAMHNGIVTSEMGRGFDPTKLTMAPGYGMASNAAGKTLSIGPSQYVAADGSQTSRWEDTQAYKDAIARNEADKMRLAEMQSRRLGTDPMAIQTARQGIASALLANKAQEATMQRNAYIQSLVTKAAAETDPLKQRAIIDTALAAQGKDSKHGKNLQVVDLGEYSVPDGIGGLKVVKRGQALYDADTKQVIPITPGQGGGAGGSAPQQSFASQAEAEAAQKSGRIKVGDVVIIGGKRFAVE